MTNLPDTYENVRSLLVAERPKHPVYFFFPHIIHETAKTFTSGFPGRVLYAVKANSEPAMLKHLTEAGITHFDCASLPEIAQVHTANPDAKKYFMIPTRIRGAAQTAQEEYGVKHFLVDHQSGLEQLLSEINPEKSVIFARMAVHHKSAYEDLSVRFGALPDDIPALLETIRQSGAEPALAFNVGSCVTEPAAYEHAISVAKSVLEKLPFKIRLVDIGGGFPKPYPGFQVPELDAYFNTVKKSVATLPLADNAEIMGEPGRALSASGMSSIAEVLLRKDNRLYLNDGMYGALWMLRFQGPRKFPVRAYRNGEILGGDQMDFILNGPTCDSTDTLPLPSALPTDIQAGDYIEFGNVGAYSVSGRTDFNGYYSDRFVTITNPSETPPLLDE